MNRIPALLLVLGSVACTSPEPVEGVTETGNPELTARVALRARSSDPTSVSVRGSGDVDVDALWMAVESVQLFQRRACEDDGVSSFVDPFVSDATARVPQLQSGKTEATVYCGALIRLDPTADPGDGPDDLAGNTLVMTGLSEERRPFVLRTALAFDVPLSRDEGNFYIDASRDRLDVGIDVAAWLDEIDIDDGVPDGTGTIVIDATSNADLLEGFEAGLLDAMDLEIVDD